MPNPATMQKLPVPEKIASAAIEDGSRPCLWAKWVTSRPPFPDSGGSDDHTTVVIHQIVVVVSETRWAPPWWHRWNRDRWSRPHPVHAPVLHRGLLFHIPQILAHGVMDLGCFPQLARVECGSPRWRRCYETAIDRRMLALHQPDSTHCPTICSNNCSNNSTPANRPCRFFENVE